MLDMHIRPSELLGIDDAYTAFCFDEACAFIINKLKDGEKPTLNKSDNKSTNSVYTKPSDLYNKYN